MLEPWVGDVSLEWRRIFIFSKWGSPGEDICLWKCTVPSDAPTQKGSFPDWLPPPSCIDRIRNSPFCPKICGAKPKPVGSLEMPAN